MNVVNVISYTICAIYFALMTISIIQIIRIYIVSRRIHKHLLAKKAFHIIVFLVMAARGFLFIFYPKLINDEILIPTKPFLLWLHLADLGYLLAYIILLFFWADFVHDLVYLSERGFFFQKHRSFITGVFSIFGTTLISWTLAVICVPDLEGAYLFLDKLITIFLTLLFLAASFGLGYYGLRIYSLIVTIQSNTLQKRKKKATKIGIIALICTICFFSKVALLVIALFKDLDSHKLDMGPLPTFIFFVVTEIIPTSLMLFLLRKLPSAHRATLNINEY